MEKFKLRYICENCGKVGLYHTETEAFSKGWDYPPKIGNYRAIGPRTCGKCSIDTTLYWAILTGEIKSINDMTPEQKTTLIRILGEPETISIDEN